MSEEVQPNKRLDFLGEISALRLRAEKETDGKILLDSVVDLVSFDTLASSNTQLIYGRNGTGKTHLLRAFHQDALDRFDKIRVLPVYIDCRVLDLGPFATDVAPEQLLLSFYRRFIEKVLDQLREHASALLDQNFLAKLYGTDAAKRGDRIRASLVELESMLNFDELEQAIPELVRNIKRERASAREFGGGASVGGEASTSAAGAAASASGNLNIEGSAKRSERETIEVVCRGLAFVDFSRVRSLIEGVIDQAGASALVILLDEWSSVSFAQQPLLAEMIKKSLCTSDRIYLKIASLKFFTQIVRRVDAKERIGLQPGVDIDVVADLDHILCHDRDPKSVRMLLLIVLWYHLKREVPELAETFESVEALLLAYVFDGDEALREIFRASEGNPRDLIGMLHLCADRVMQTKDSRIGTRSAIALSAQYFRENKQPELAQNSRGLNAYERLFESAVKHKSKLFRVTTRRAAGSLLLQELWQHRFVHLIEEEISVIDDDEQLASYALYSLDYGKLLSLKVRRRGERLVETMMSTLDTATAVSASSGLLSILLRKLMSVPAVEKRLTEAAERTAVRSADVEEGDVEGPLLAIPLADDLLEEAASPV